MQLYVIRHGQKATATDEYDSGTNPPLSGTGRRQAEHLGEFMAGEDVDRLYSSCMLRSMETAAAVHERIDCEWHVWPIFCESTMSRWADLHGGAPDSATDVVAWQTDESAPAPTRAEHADELGEYYLLSEIPELFPDVQLSQPFPWPEAWWVPRRGQTYAMGYGRIALALPAVLERHDEGDRVAIVCHGIIGDTMLTHLMDFPRNHQVRRFAFDNTGVARLDWLPDRLGPCADGRASNFWWLKYTNRTSHLPAELQV